MTLRVLILGRLPTDLKREIESLDDSVELLEAPEGLAGLAQVAHIRPHLFVLGEDAPTTAAVLAATTGGREGPVPILAAGEDPDADLRMREPAVSRERVLRLARRLAHMERALQAASSRNRSVVAPSNGKAAFRSRLDYEFSRAVRYRHPVSVVALSVDGGERLTSLAGDSALEEFRDALAETLHRCVRDVDLLFRADGPEIAAILPDTPASGAEVVAIRFLHQTGRLVFKPKPTASRPSLPWKATSSIGVADAPREGIGTPDQVLARALEAMVEAGRNGGCRVVVHGASARP